MALIKSKEEKELPSSQGSEMAEFWHRNLRWSRQGKKNAPQLG
jgi:hypothetical protein